MDSGHKTKWGHGYLDQGGQIEILLQQGLTEDEIIKEFAKLYPDHRNPRNRVKRALNHFRVTHNVDLNKYLGKGHTSSSESIQGEELLFEAYSPLKSDIEKAESQIRRCPDEVIGIDAVLKQMEEHFRKAGKQLKPNWREITRKNIEIWFSKNNFR